MDAEEASSPSLGYSPSVVESGDGDEEDKYTQPLIPGWRSQLFYALIASWWCAIQLSTSALTSVVWPAQISAMLGNPILEDLYNGFIPAPGAFVSLLTAPIAGVLSDNSQHYLGRRKVYIIVGSVIVAVLTICMGPLNVHSGPKSVFALMALICVYQFGAMIGVGPYAGLVPDLVKKDKIGIASGWMGAGLSFGTIIGLIGAGFLIDKTGRSFWNAYIFLAVLFIVFTLPTILGLREIPRPPPKEEFSWKGFCASFYLDPKIYSNFYWIIITRFFFAMGTYTVIPFLQYFFKDILQTPSAALLSSLAIALLVFMCIPATIVAGFFSDKYGRKNMIYVGISIMALGCAAYAIICYHPSLTASFIIAAFVGIGYGIFIAVDWAIALDALPPGADIAKDMGIWHLSMVLPNVIAPIIAGAIVSSVKQFHSSPAAYCTLFSVAVGWYLLSLVCFYPVKIQKKFTSVKP